eukprot:g32423.t1
MHHDTLVYFICAVTDKSLQPAGRRLRKGNSCQVPTFPILVRKSRSNCITPSQQNDIIAINPVSKSTPPVSLLSLKLGKLLSHCLAFNFQNSKSQSGATYALSGPAEILSSFEKIWLINPQNPFGHAVLSFNRPTTTNKESMVNTVQTPHPESPKSEQRPCTVDLSDALPAMSPPPTTNLSECSDSGSLQENPHRPFRRVTSFLGQEEGFLMFDSENLLPDNMVNIQRSSSLELPDLDVPVLNFNLGAFWLDDGGYLPPLPFRQPPFSESKSITYATKFGLLSPPVSTSSLSESPCSSPLLTGYHSDEETAHDMPVEGSNDLALDETRPEPVEGSNDLALDETRPELCQPRDNLSDVSSTVGAKRKSHQPNEPSAFQQSESPRYPKRRRKTPSSSASEARDDVDQDDLVTVGQYTRAERRAKIAYFKEKWHRSKKEKFVRYRIRSRFASNRPRIGGRFVKLDCAN